MCPGGALPCEVLLCVDPRKQTDPGQGRILPVDQTLLERTAKLRAGPGILQEQRDRGATLRNIEKKNFLRSLWYQRFTCRLGGRELNRALQCWLIPTASSCALGCSAQERERGEVKRRRVLRLQSAGYSVHIGGAMEAGVMAWGLYE